jgi:hypothetical protein
VPQGDAESLADGEALDGLGDGDDGGGEELDRVGVGDLLAAGVDVFGAAGFVVVPTPMLAGLDVALADAVAETDADVESDGSVMLPALPLGVDTTAGDIVDTDAADDFGEPPLEIM